MSITCWAGTSSAFEVKLLTPLPKYALEQLRQRFIFSLTSPSDNTKSARVLFQMAFETELQAVLAKMITLPASVPASVVCERRHFIDIDKDLQLQRFLIGPAFDALEALPTIPVPYVDLLKRYASSDYPRYRVCSIASMLCLATFLLT